MERRFGGSPLLRLALAVVVAVDIASYFFFIGEARAAALGRGAFLGGFVDLLSHPLTSASIVAIGLVSAVAFARRAGQLSAGAISLVSLSLLSAVHGQLFGSPWRHLYFSGVCLAGWLVGLLYCRLRGAPRDESYARVGAIALLGAAYLNSGISKLVYGGLEWLSGTPVQAAIVAQEGLVVGGIIGSFRAWATTPEVAMFFSVATVALELSGPLMLVGRRTRAAVAMGLAAMHLTIWLLTGVIVYWESIVLLLVFGLSVDQPLRSPAGSRSARFAAAVVLLSLWALAAIGHQVWRFADSREILHVGAAMPQVAEPAPTAEPSMPPSFFKSAVGPFVVGETVSDWSIESLNTTDGGFVVTLSGEPGQVRFTVTCAMPEVRGLFDLEAARILYSSDLEPSQFADAGNALRERMSAATRGREVCDAVEEWRTAAMTGEGALR